MIVTKRPSIPVYNNDEHYHGLGLNAIFEYVVELEYYCTYLENEVVKCEARVERVRNQQVEMVKMPDWWTSTERQE